MWTQLCCCYVTLMETRDYCDLCFGVQVMSVCLVDVSVAGRVAIVLWLPGVMTNFKQSDMF